MNPISNQPQLETLSNGVKVLFQHLDGPAAAIYWWVNVGSADEKPFESGFAHFLEHMCFKDAAAKDSGMASEGQLAREIESLGGDINAYTSFDQTVYHAACPESSWERVVDRFGSIANQKKFLKSDFDSEREVILEELRKNEDSPDRQLFQSVFSSVFHSHPYGRPVIGFQKTLKAAKVTQLESFFRKHYCSGNMGLILVGPLTAKRKLSLIKLLEKRFGSKVFKKTSYQFESRKPEPELRKNAELVLKKFDVKSPTLAVSFRVPGLKHPDTPVLDLIGTILGSGESSRLYQKLFVQKSLVTDVSSGLYVPRDPGMLYFSAEFNDSSQVEKIADEFFSEIARMTSGEITDEEKNRAVTLMESEKLYASQSVDGMAGRLGYLQFGVGDLAFDDQYVAALRAVRPEAIRRVAREYLQYQRMGCVMMDAKSAPKDSWKPDVLKKKLMEFFPAPKAQASKESAKASNKTGTYRLPVRFFTRPSGMRVVHIERPTSPVFAINAMVLGGSRLEKDQGASHVLAETWTQGIPGMDSHQIAKLVEGRAAGMDGFSGRNSLGLKMTGLVRDWSELSAIYSRVLCEPEFPESEIAHTRRVVEESIRSIDDHSSQVVSRLFLETLFQKHPYGLLQYGTIEGLPSMTQELLRKYHRSWVRSSNLVVSLSGAVGADDIESWLEKMERQLALGASKFAAIGRENVESEAALPAPRWVELAKGREQTHILIGGLGVTMTSEDRFALRLLQNILGGQSGRLFIELREKKSLAYTVSPMMMEGMEAGYVGSYIACSPNKKQEAIDGIRTVLEGLAKKGPTAKELNRAKELYTGEFSMELQSDRALSSHYGLQTLYGFTPEDEVTTLKKIKAVTAKDIQRVCRTYFLDAHQVTAVVT